MSEPGSQNVQEVLEGIGRHHCPSPDTIQVLLSNRQTAVPALAAILEETSHWKRLPDEPWDTAIHAVFLLAALDAPEGLAPVVRLLRKPNAFIDEFFGDILTECLSWALARLARTQPDALVELAHDVSLDPYIRATALRGVVAQARLWPERRPFVIRALDGLLQAAAKHPDPDWNALLVDDVALMAPPELRSKADALFERGAVDLTFITKADVEAAYQRGGLRNADMTELLDVVSLYRTHRDLLGWNDPEAAAQRETGQRTWQGDEEASETEEPPAVSSPSGQVGRNQRCPCGSNRKYKKCCLGASSATVLGRVLAALDAATTVEQLKADIRAAVTAEELVRPSTVIAKTLRRPDGEEATFASQAQASLFVAHFQALWNHLARYRQLQHRP